MVEEKSFVGWSKEELFYLELHQLIMALLKTDLAGDFLATIECQRDIVLLASSYFKPEKKEEIIKKIKNIEIVVFEYLNLISNPKMQNNYSLIREKLKIIREGIFEINLLIFEALDEAGLRLQRIKPRTIIDAIPKEAREGIFREQGRVN